MRLAAVAAHLGRDLDRGLAKVLGIVAGARARGVDLLVLPHASLGGYLTDLRDPDPTDPPPALRADHPALAAVAAASGGTVVCLGYTEAGTGPESGLTFDAALCVGEGAVLGRHRKVHQAGAGPHSAGDVFAAVDTPVGRLGLMIDHDKTFPEAARALALDGAEVLACLSAWPASVTDRSARLVRDRQSRLFDLYDAARAAENQVVLLSSNQSGAAGRLLFLGQAKVVGPGGETLARTGTKGGMAVVDVDVAGEVARARRVLHHLAERRPEAYGPAVQVPITDERA